MSMEQYTGSHNLVIILLLVKPVGIYLVNVFDYEKTGLDRVFGPD